MINLTLAYDIICDFINLNSFQFTIKYEQSNLPGNRTIENFNKFTPAYITSCESAINTKLAFPKEIYSYPVYINISFRPCPPGFSLSKDPPFRCGLVWISTDGNETMAASNCPYNYCNREEINMPLQDPDSQCNFNHSGTLCGGCQPGLSLTLGTNHCLHCPNTHLALLLPFALAGVVLVCFIKVIDLTISQGTLNGLIFYANVVKANEYLYKMKSKQIHLLCLLHGST